MEERDNAITRLCEDAVDRLADALPGREVACLLVSEDSLRHVAHRGVLRFIFELPRELGGIAWRTVRTAEPQQVADVTVDGDYVASDDAITSEVTAPVVVDGSVVAVLDVESVDRLGEHESTVVTAEADRLAASLAPYFRSYPGYV